MKFLKYPCHIRGVDGGVDESVATNHFPFFLIPYNSTFYKMTNIGVTLHYQKI